MQNAKAYWRVLTSAAREDGANPHRIIMSIAQLAGRVLLIVAIYQVAYKVNARPGLSFANAMWGISTYFAFILALDIRNIARVIDLEVKYGKVETALNKPLDWRMVKICEHLGKRGIEFLIQLLLLPLLVFFVAGLPDLSYMSPLLIVGEIAMILLAVTAVMAIFIMVGLSAFWLNDATSVFRIVDKLAAIFCGAFVPFALLPGVVQEFVRWSPFGIYASPQLLFNPNVSHVIVPTLVSGVLWTIIVVLGCQFMWRRVQRRIEVNGG